MSVNNNEPAFPVDSVAEHQHCGMSLRDYFAAKAMQAVLSNDELLNLLGDGIESQAELHRKLAKAAYKQADAMLAIRAD